jgi:putative tryptophan/tyrosine transport system substrate-binding protein
MNLRRALIAILTAIAWTALPAAGQIPKVGYIATASPESTKHLLDAFRAGMRERGYVEGQNVVMEYRWADGTSLRLEDLAAELVRTKVDVILAWGTPASAAAKKATSTIPIVMTAVGDPVGASLVANLARPGGNVTGLTNSDVGLAAKRLELLKTIVPGLSSVGVLKNPSNPSSALQYQETQAAAKLLGIGLHAMDVRSPQDFEAVFAAAAKARVSAMIGLGDPMFVSHRDQIAGLALKSRLASAFPRAEIAQAGALMAYGPSNVDQFRQAAGYVQKILQGAKPGDLPIEQPARMELVINLRTAKGLGLTLPASLLVRADVVID